MSKAKKVELKMTNEKNTIREGPSNVKGAIDKLRTCQKKRGKDCTKERQQLTRVKANSCTGKNKTSANCKNAADALKKGKYKFHPVYGYLRY